MRDAQPESDADAATVETRPLTVDDAIVDQVVLVPRHVWPTYKTCAENGGAGWTARIVSATSRSALVRFPYARTAQGKPYEKCRLPLDQLRLIVARHCG